MKNPVGKVGYSQICKWNGVTGTCIGQGEKQESSLLKELGLRPDAPGTSCDEFQEQEG